MLAVALMQVVRVKEADIATMNKQLDAANNNLEAARSDLSTARAALKVRQLLSACLNKKTLPCHAPATQTSSTCYVPRSTHD
jgi:F0F1-type ATP synthase epsilon subunit